MLNDEREGNIEEEMLREEMTPKVERRKYDRRKTDRDLKNLLNVLDGISEGFFILNRNWEFTYLNKVAEKIFRKKAMDLLSKNIWLEHPKFIGSHLEKEAKRSLNEQVPLAIEIKGLYTDKWYDYHSFPSVDGLSVIIQDITQAKKLEAEIARFDRLNSLGEMAACIGHELRNPMTAVRGYLQLLGEKEEGLPFKDSFNLMIAELDRCNEIITEFLSLAKNRVLNLELANLNEIIYAIAPLVLSEGLMFEKNLLFELSEVPDFWLDKNEIKQLILNLIHNAQDAMEDGKTITIRTYQQQKEVVLEVKDQGRGIDESIRDKIGNPFVSTKENGIGLGLAVCYSIADRHDAVITFDSNQEGTIFFVRFHLTNLA